MKRIVFVGTLICLMMIGISSCTEEDATSHDSILADSDMPTALGKDEAMNQFAEILSRAVVKNESLRAFIKKEALCRIDNSADVLYQLVKDERVGNMTFKQMLELCTNSPKQLDLIEQSVPMLNIHLPEYAQIVADSMNISDSDLPVLYDTKVYLNGQVVDSLDQNEIPGFLTLVVCENNKLTPIATGTRSVDTNVLGGKFAFVAKSFNPAYNTHNTRLTTRSVEYDTPDSKYDEGFSSVPASDIDPLVLDAYKNAEGNLCTTRYMLYNDLKSINETPTNLRTDVSDCLWRFKIASNAFVSLQDVAEGNNNSKPLFNKGFSHMKSPLSREEVLNHFLTGRTFCFLFEVQSSVNNDKAYANEFKVYASPDKIFNLKIDESRRHHTAFRHTKYTYSIDVNGIRPKWFYPLENSYDTRLGSWDISKDPIQKRITIYLVNPDDGNTTTTTESYSIQYVKGADLGLNISALIKKLTIGGSVKLNASNTTSKTVTATNTVVGKNEKLGDYDINYFNDYPIESMTKDGRIVLMRKGVGEIETSIIPISNNFFTVKRYEK